MGQERFVPLALDLTAPDAAQQVLDAADGPIDALANVAGINDDFAPLHEVDDDVWQRVFAVNVDAVMRLTRAVLPGMRQARRGSVAIVTSEAGLRGGASGAAYTASKHAVIGLTKSCAFMYARDGVRVNALAPGGVATGPAFRCRARCRNSASRVSRRRVSSCRASRTRRSWPPRSPSC